MPFTPEETLLYVIGQFHPISYKHIEGQLGTNPFVQMAKQNYHRQDYVNAELIFKMGKDYYNCFFDKLDWKYYIYKFHE
jgi:hypothetical protein